MNPLVSIIITNYNKSPYLLLAINSVIAQTYKNWEIILIDDGSYDNSVSLIKENFFNYDNITLIEHNKNWGIKKAKKTYDQALKYCKGELIALLDGDDLWDKKRLEKQIPFFNNSKVVLSYSNGYLIDKKGSKIDLEFYDKKINDLNNVPTGSILKCFIDLDFYLLTSSVIIRKKSLEAIGGFKNSSNYPFIDVITWWYLALQGPFAYCNHILVSYRKHDNSSWFKFAAKTKSMVRDEMSKSFMEFIEKNKDLLNKKGIFFSSQDIIVKHKVYLANKSATKKITLLKHYFVFHDKNKLFYTLFGGKLLFLRHKKVLVAVNYFFSVFVEIVILIKLQTKFMYYFILKILNLYYR